MRVTIQRGAWALLAWLGLALAAAAAGAPTDESALIYGSGQPDKGMPPWAISVPKPDGWQIDCCNIAKSLGVNLAMYRGQWTGKPERVMVLLVWASESSSLDSQVQTDRQRYLQRHPEGKIEPFPVTNTYGMTCQGMLYKGYQRGAHTDDAVAFCGPKSKNAGLQLSWTMTVAQDDPARQAMLALFRRVVEGSLHLAYVPAHEQPRH